MKNLIYIFVLLVTLNVQAGVTTGVTTIGDIYTYADNEDVIFTVNIDVNGCTGFWLEASNLGFRNQLSVLLSAYHASSPIYVYGDESKTFSGSSDKYCRLTILKLQAK